MIFSSPLAMGCFDLVMKRQIRFLPTWWILDGLTRSVVFSGNFKLISRCASRYVIYGRKLFTVKSNCYSHGTAAFAQQFLFVSIYIKSEHSPGKSATPERRWERYIRLSECTLELIANVVNFFGPVFCGWESRLEKAKRRSTTGMSRFMQI